MIERLTPEEYEQRQVSDVLDPEAYLDKELSEQAEEQRYIYGDPPAEEPAPQEPTPQAFAEVCRKVQRAKLVIIVTGPLENLLKQRLTKFKNFR